MLWTKCIPWENEGAEHYSWSMVCQSDTTSLSWVRRSTAPDCIFCPIEHTLSQNEVTWLSRTIVGSLFLFWHLKPWCHNNIVSWQLISLQCYLRMFLSNIWHHEQYNRVSSRLPHPSCSPRKNGSNRILTSLQKLAKWSCEVSAACPPDQIFGLCPACIRLKWSLDTFTGKTEA